MPATYDKIAAYTVPSATASYTFTSIPSTYTDLVLICAWSKSAGARMNINYNGDTASNYSYTRMNGNGTSASSDRISNFGIIDGGYTTTTLATSIIQIMNYSNTTTNKTTLIRTNSTAEAAGAFVALWRSTAAINSIALGGANDFPTGTSFTLYGIKAA